MFWAWGCDLGLSGFAFSRSRVLRVISGSLLDTILHFCYDKAQEGLSMIIFIQPQEGIRFRVYSLGFRVQACGWDAGVRVLGSSIVTYTLFFLLGGGFLIIAKV